MSKNNFKDWATQLRAACNDTYKANESQIWIDQGALEALAARLPAKEVRSSVKGLYLPMKFDSLKQEVTLMSLYHLMDFGSGYDPLLLAKTRRDARETVQFGIIGLHIQGKTLDYHWMRAFSAFDITSIFGLDGREDAPVQGLPGVTMSRPGVLDRFSQALVTSVKEAGAALDAIGSRDLGEMVLTVVDELRAKERSKIRAAGGAVEPCASAVRVVEDLVENIPGFADRVLVTLPANQSGEAGQNSGDGADSGESEGRNAGMTSGSKSVALPFHRKAQALVAALSGLLGNKDSRLKFSDLDKLCGDSSPLTIAALRAAGVLSVSDEVAKLLESSEELPSGNLERALRAASVVACDRLVEAAAAAAAAAALAGVDVCKAAAASQEAEPTKKGEEESKQGEKKEEDRKESPKAEGAEDSSKPLCAIQVSAYLQFLMEEGQELHGKVKPHRTTGTTAY